MRARDHCSGIGDGARLRAALLERWLTGQAPRKWDREQYWLVFQVSEQEKVSQWEGSSLHSGRSYHPLIVVPTTPNKNFNNVYIIYEFLCIKQGLKFLNVLFFNNHYFWKPIFMPKHYRR